MLVGEGELGFSISVVMVSSVCVMIRKGVWVIGLGY